MEELAAQQLSPMREYLGSGMLGFAALSLLLQPR